MVLLLKQPDPEDSSIIRFAMLLVGLIAFIGGVIGLLDGSWIGGVCLGFSALILWGWGIARSRARIKKQAIILTDSAARAIKNVAQKERDPSLIIFFVKISENGYQLDFVESVDTYVDKLITSKGVRLAYPIAQEKLLSGTVIDFIEQESQSGFVFQYKQD